MNKEGSKSAGGLPERPIEQERKPSGFLVFDDNYSKTLADLFTEGKEEKPVVSRARDLVSAIECIDNLENTRGVGVLTDMFMPEKEGSVEAKDGLKIIQEIFEFYGVDPQEAQASINRVKVVLDKYGDRIRQITDQNSKSIPGSEPGGRSSDNPIVKEIYTAFLGQLSGTLLQFAEKRFPRCKNSSRVDKRFIEEWEDRKITPETLQKRLDSGDFERHSDGTIHYTQRFIDSIGLDGVGEKTQNFQKREEEEYPPFERESAWEMDNIRMISGAEFISIMAKTLTWGKDGGVLAGIRIAEKAHQKGLPVVVVSGGHETSAISPFLARYLYDKGIIDNPWIVGRIELEANQQLRPDAQDLANSYSYFDLSKNTQDERFRAANLAKLKLAAESLRLKTQALGGKI
jgi:hypothetical protein